MKLDERERQILRALQQDGRLSNVELAEQVGLSESPCFRRVKQLEQTGVITGYCALVDQRKLGLPITAFVQVALDKQNETAVRRFIECVAAEQHIVECHAMSGSHHYLMKVVAHSIDHFSELCMQRILKFPGVKTIESDFSLREIKQSRVLPT